MSDKDLKTTRRAALGAMAALSAVAASGAVQTAQAQTAQKTFVLVHGTWHGGGDAGLNRQTSHLNGDGAMASALWSPEILARALNLGSDHAVLNMIVDQPHCLHEGVNRGRSDEFPALFF